MDFKLRQNRVTCDACFGIADCPYVDNGDGTVTDTRSDLMWMRCSIGQSWSGNECTGVITEYYHPNFYLGGAYPSSSLANHSDWRIPTTSELKTIVDDSCQPATINQQVFPGTTAHKYYSTEYSGGGYVPVLNFNSGKQELTNARSTNYYRLVRPAH